MFRTIRSKLFISYGVLVFVTVFMGVMFIVIFNNYLRENENLVENKFIQVVRTGEFVAAKNKLINSSSLLVSAPNKKELIRHYNIIRDDLNQFKLSARKILKDPLFKDWVCPKVS